MAFLDKLSEIAKNVSDMTVELAKNVGDKTGEMLEVGKLNAQISSANNSIEELKTRLGDYYWNLFNKGEKLDDDAIVLCNTIKEYSEEIASLKVQLAQLKAKRQEAFSQKCPACSTLNSPDAVFCKNCGTKLEEETENTSEQETEPTETCVCCDNSEETCECQNASAEPAKKTCSNCGAENESNNTFCDKCGSKL